MNKIVKEHFKNYGLSKTVLKQLESLVLATSGDDADDDKLKEVCTTFDSLAKTMQSDIDARVTKARKDAEVEKPNPGGNPSPTDDEPKSDLDKVLARLTTMQEKLDNLEQEKTTTKYTLRAQERLREIKMNDAEIKSALYNRKFQSDDDLEEFVTKQEEFYADIVKERISTDTPTGEEPRGKGSVSDKSFEKQLEEFNKKN